MKKIIRLLPVLGLAFAAHADVTISAVGNGTAYDITGTEASGYRSSNIVKSFDVGTSADNAYGTDGYLVWGGAGTSNSQEFPNNTVSSDPSFLTAYTVDTGSTVSHKNSSNVTYDDASLAIGADVDDFGNGANMLMNSPPTDEKSEGDWNQLLSFTVDDTITSFRLGIMGGAENDATGKFDPTGFRVSFEGGTAVEVTSLEQVDDTIGMVFFDIALDGTVGSFAIEGQRRSSHTSITGLTFDAIPEPATLGMVAVFGGGILFIRRRLML